MANINWQFQASVQGGPALAINTPGLSVATYDVVQFAIEAGKSATLPIPPSGAAGDILLLVLTSDQYDAKNLSFDIGTSTTPNPFDGPLLLIGSGAVGLLSSGGTPPSSLTVNNKLTITINVQLMVGRNVP